jgi:hypothetical protein
MHLMFFLSGMFVWSSLRRKGAKNFLSRRFVRLGVPFAIGIFLLMPVAHYPVYRVTAVDPSWSAFWAHWKALPFWATGQLWFLWHLLLLNIIAAALFRFAPSSGELLGRLSKGAGERPGRYFAALVCVSALAYMPLASLFRPWQWIQYGPFALQPGFTLHYIVYFFAGLGIGAYGVERGLAAPDGMLVRHWLAWVAGACGAFVFWIVVTAVITQEWAVAVPGLEIAADFGLVLASGAMSVALVAVFVRFGARRVAGFDNLSENAYGIYLVHYVFVIWLQYMMLGFVLPAIVKGATVFAGTLLLSWLSTAAIWRLRMAARVLGWERVPVRAR